MLCGTNTKCKCYIKCNEIPEIFGEGVDVMHSHDAEREACLNRQILTNSVKRKAMEDLCERPRKVTHKELPSQYLDTLAYKDIRNISRNMYKASFFQLLPLPRDIEETHKALSAVPVLTVRQNLLVNNSEKNYCNVFMQKQLTVFSSIDVLYVDGTFKSAPQFFHQLFTIH